MKNKLSILLLFLCLNTVAQVPNTNTFSLSDVVAITGGTSLQAAFTNSVDAYFDPAYKGSKDNLLNFRNYRNITISGYLYNWYAVTDARNISSSLAHAPTKAEFITLINYLTANGYGYGGSGADIAKSVSYNNYWIGFINPPVGTPANNQSINNSSGFNAFPAGIRVANGGYGNFNMSTHFWNSTTYWMSPTQPSVYQLAGNIATFNETGFTKVCGLSVRLVMNSTILTNGQTGTYTGNDGHVYTTICIGTQEWMSENLIETKYRNNDDIPVVTNNAAWAALTAGARCSYP
jgi:uncharacterized protein (TIGR02145 family)